MPASVRIRGMKPISVLLVGVALALTACDRSSESGPTTETGRPTTETGSPTVEPDARTVAVYSAVVRQLVTEDHTFGEDESPFEGVFIDVRIDGECERPGVPGSHAPTGPTALRRGAGRDSRASWPTSHR